MDSNTRVTTFNTSKATEVKIGKSAGQHLTVLVSALVALFLVGTANAQTYIGEACWLTESGGEPSNAQDYVKLAFLDIGDLHLTVNGFSFSTDDQSVDERTLLNGNAEFFGNQIVMSLNGTVSDEGVAIAMAVHIKISGATLNGTYEAYGTGYDLETQESELFVDAGTLTIAACPSL